VEANSQQLSDLMAGVVTAANQPGVSVVSMSWGLPEGQAVFQQDEALYDADLTTPAGHQPVTFVASTGDYGTADPEYPAFSANVLAVGGTSLYLNSDNSYNTETGWGYYSSSVGALIGSGGGTSLYEPEPAYQIGVQSTGNRSTPDVAFVADPRTGAWIADPYNLSASNPWEVAGGTSLSAPCWAGLIAIANQGRAGAGESTLSSSGSVEAQQALYSLPEVDFNTITSGNNGGYTAAAGYNMVTGLGTPVANLLLPGLIAYQGISPANLSAANEPANNAASSNGGVSGGPCNVFHVFDVEAAGSNALGSGRRPNVNSGPSPTLSRAVVALPLTNAGMATPSLNAGPSGLYIDNPALGGSTFYYGAFTPAFTINLQSGLANSATGAVNAVHSLAGSYGSDGLPADELSEVLLGRGGNGARKLAADADLLAGIDAFMAEWGRAELSSTAPDQGGI